MTRRIAFVASATLSLALADSVARAQEPVDRAMIQRITAEATDHSKVGETFNYFVNVIGARLAGTAAHKRAAEYARTKLTEWGIRDAHLEPFPFGRSWELQQFTMELTSPRYFPLVGFPEAWTPGAQELNHGASHVLGRQECCRH